MREHIRGEFAKLRVMNFAEKRQYIWEYYKLHIIFGGILLVLVGSLINTWFINPPPRQGLYIAWGEVPIAGNRAAQVERLANTLTQRVQLGENEIALVVDYSATGNASLDMTLRTRFFLSLRVGDVDVLISTAQGIYEHAAGELIRPVFDLTDALAGDLQSKATARMLEVTYTTTDVNDNPVATFTNYMAISLAGSPLLAEYGITSQDVYLALIINATRIDTIATLLEELLYGI
jgi:hypothetical protein